MLVIEVALALFTLITEFSKVRVRGSSWRGCSELKLFANNLESSINSPERISFTSLGGNLCTESKFCWDGNTVDIVPICAIDSSRISGFLDCKRNVVLTWRVSLRNNSLRRRRRTSEGVHRSLGSCGRGLFDRLVDGCLDQGLNLGQLALRQHSLVRRVAVQRVLDLLLQLLKVVLQFYDVAAILNRGWGANSLCILPGFFLLLWADRRARSVFRR